MDKTLRYHVIIHLDCFYFQEGDVNISKDERHIQCLSPKLSLYVYECIELSLTPNPDLETNFDQMTKNDTSADIHNKKEEYFAVKLFHGNISRFIIKKHSTSYEVLDIYHI